MESAVRIETSLRRSRLSLEDAKEDRLSSQLFDRVSSEEFRVITNLRTFGGLTTGSTALGYSKRTSRTASSSARSRFKEEPVGALLGDAGLEIQDTPSTCVPIAW